MIENTQNTDNTETDATEAPIQVNIEGDKPKALAIDLDGMSYKQLADFDRKDLLAICEEKNLFKNMKKWEIDRHSRIKLAKLLKANVEKKEAPKEETFEAPQEEAFEVDTSNFQKGLVQLFEGKEPVQIDEFAKEVISKSQYALISPETAQRMEKYLYYGSMTWLGYRRFFGTIANLKAFFKMIKEKMNRKKEKVETNA